VDERLVRRLRAAVLGVNPNCSAACRTRRAVAVFTRPLVRGLRARDAVALWTPARAATSDMVGRLFTEAV
jgi:hypothetical protein